MDMTSGDDTRLIVKAAYETRRSVARMPRCDESLDEIRTVRWYKVSTHLLREPQRFSRAPAAS